MHEYIHVTVWSWENSSDLRRLNIGNTGTFFSTSRTDLFPDYQLKHENRYFQKDPPNLVLRSD